MKDNGTGDKGILGFFTNSPIGIFGLVIAAIVFGVIALSFLGII